VIVVDTGPLVAIADADDQAHEQCIAALAHASRPFIVPSSVVVEVCSLLQRELGSRAEAAFLRGFSAHELVLANVTVADLDRMADLVDTDRDQTSSELPLHISALSLENVGERHHELPIGAHDAGPGSGSDP
jgi:predicted nucleic acid-binding protein